MTNDSLMFQAAQGLEEANTVVQAAWNEQGMSHPQSLLLVAALQLALAAARELERRAAGVAPPRVGD